MILSSSKYLALSSLCVWLTFLYFLFLHSNQKNFLESVGDYLSDICHLACKHKVKLEASFINAALACEIMEGIASTLCPTLEVQKYALPMVIKAEMMHGLRGGLRGMNLL